MASDPSKESYGSLKATEGELAFGPDTGGKVPHEYRLPDYSTGSEDVPYPLANLDWSEMLDIIYGDAEVR